jgi:hypothetical protein
VIWIYLLFPGFLLGLLTLLQLQVGELLPWLNAPPQLLLMGGLLLCLTLPKGVSLWMTLCFAALLDLWANSGVFQLVTAIVCLGPVWGFARFSDAPLRIYQVFLAGIWVTIAAECCGALGYLSKGNVILTHLWHILPPLLAYHLVLLTILYPVAKLVLNPLSQTKI